MNERRNGQDALTGGFELVIEGGAALAKALKQALSLGDRLLAAREAKAIRGAFTGYMSTFFSVYEDAYRAYESLEEIVRRQPDAAPSLRADDIAARKRHLRNKAIWLLRSGFYVYYRSLFMLGKQVAGNARPLDAAEQERIRRIANNEAQFAINALHDAETGEYFMPLVQRGELYGNASNELFWYGYLSADLSRRRYVRWKLGGDECCIDCAFLAGRLDRFITKLMAKAEARGYATPREEAMLEEALRRRAHQGGRWGNGIYSAYELSRMAIVPQSGKLACTTRCHCRLVPAQRPKRPPKHKEFRTEFISLAPKVPTMLNRVTRRKQRQRLAELAEAWRDEHILRKKPRRIGREIYRKR